MESPSPPSVLVLFIAGDCVAAPLGTQTQRSLVADGDTKAVGAVLKGRVSLMANGDFQSDANTDNTPDGWPGADGTLSWGKEGDNRFLRITSTETGKLAMVYRMIDVPAGVKALELRFKERVSNLKVGKTHGSTRA